MRAALDQSPAILLALGAVLGFLVFLCVPVLLGDALGLLLLEALGLGEPLLSITFPAALGVLGLALATQLGGLGDRFVNDAADLFLVVGAGDRREQARVGRGG